jgi:hypothetical protein
MKNYVIAAVVIILIIGAIVWYRGRNVTPVDTSDVTATTTVETTSVSTDASSTGTTTAQ